MFSDNTFCYFFLIIKQNSFFSFFLFNHFSLSLWVMCLITWYFLPGTSQSFNLNQKMVVIQEHNFKWALSLKGIMFFFNSVLRTIKGNGFAILCLEICLIEIYKLLKKYLTNGKTLWYVFSYQCFLINAYEVCLFLNFENSQKIL